MARTVKILGRTYLPGPGFTSGGTPKQGKTQAWGVINITSYTTGGEDVSPNDLGLTTIDHASFRLKSVDGVNTTAVNDTVEYRDTTSKLVVYDSGSQATSTEAAVVTFHVVGDSANDVESLA